MIEVFYWKGVLNMKNRILIFILLLSATTCFGQILKVAKDDPTAINSIQAAIETAEDNDSIIVYPGIYSEENISFGGKKIKVKSSDTNNWQVIKSTIISQSYIKFITGETNDSILEGFTITLSNGIHCENSSPTIRKCYITNNWSYDHTSNYVINYEPGGGIRLIDDCNAIIENCIISGNVGSRGSGVYIRSENYLNANSKFINCTITNNNIRLNNKDNDSNAFKYQVDCTCARAEFINCIIFSDSYNFHLSDPNYPRSLFIADPALVKNSCVNLAYLSTGYYTPYSNGDYYKPDAPILNLTTVNNNISQTPEFINPLRLRLSAQDTFDGFIDGDYHLKPTSPCINAGTNDYIYTGQKGSPCNSRHSRYRRR